MRSIRARVFPGMRCRDDGPCGEKLSAISISRRSQITWSFLLWFLVLTLSCGREQSGDTAQTAGLKPPYLEKAGQRGTISIWIVDGAYIRTNIDEEFTNYGQHHGFSYIPDNEFWIDKEGKSDELNFFVNHLLIEHRLMAQGASYDSALAVADSLELVERKTSGDLQKLEDGEPLPDPRRAHLWLWKELSSGVSVWVVDGRLVRSGFDVDFTEGGHDHVYEFIPENEVWIDNDLDELERPYVLFHELHERNLMARGWDYDRAHEDASKLESHYRHNPEELHMALAREGWE